MELSDLLRKFISNGSFAEGIKQEIEVIIFYSSYSSYFVFLIVLSYFFV